MKKSDKDALKSAFNIPEPQQKSDFVASYKEKLKKNNRTTVLPVVLRYGAVAAMAAVAIVIWSASDISRKPQYDYNGGYVVSETTTDTEESSVTTVTSGGTEAYTTETTVTTALTSASAESTETTTAQTAPVMVGTENITTTAVTTAMNITSQTTTLTTPRITTASTTVSTSVTITVTTTTTTETEPPGNVYNDLTVTPSVTYEKTEDAFDLRDLNSGGTDGDQLPLPGNPTGEVSEAVVKMAQMSEYIIYASVDEILYTDIGGAPYTQENLTVYSSYKGGLEFMDRISLYLPGGYMPTDKYIELIGYDPFLPDNCTTIYDYGGNNGEQNVGDMFVFFINTSGRAFPEGSFVLTETTDVSVFRYEGDEYRSLGNSTLSFELSSLINLLN